MKSLRFSLLVLGLFSLCCATSGDGSGVKKMKMQFATGPLLKFQICVASAVKVNRVFEEYTQALYQRYPDIRIEGDSYLPIPLYRHFASFLSVFKLLVLGLIIIGKDPFALVGMQAPGIWEWGQGNKIYACMMVFFLSNMIENQLMSTGAFEITLNGFEVGFSLGCEAMFMKVCAEGRKTASTDWMPHQSSPRPLETPRP
ncbi:Selenoprotein T1a [Liparis tanakae]|uniref:Selenoprotein T n=1 Tax=Liparis tanakae TaxID=230148 RepID=A0A4Z2GRY1_9TELE|nr:Selenoprotein T1a [Liparis tanakae]